MFTLDNLSEFKDEMRLLSYEAFSSPEVISREDFVRALANKEVMYINTKEDAFLFFASLNLLNAYVKQNKSEISYNFKLDVVSGFDTVIMNNIEGVHYSHDPKEKAVIVEIDGFQFSFHNVLPSAKMDYVKNFAKTVDVKFYKEQQWEGIKLQPVAGTVFQYANNLNGLSNKSLAGNLKAYQRERVAMDRRELAKKGQSEEAAAGKGKNKR